MQNPKFEIRNSKLGNCRKAGGFTLLELIVVIFILSIVLAAALPSFVDLGEGRIKADAKRAASIIRYLNDGAMSAKETFQAKFIFKDKTLIYGGPEGEKTERLDSLSGVELQSKGMVSEGEVIVFFGPTGAGESFTVHMGEGKSHMAVELNNMSGRVRIRMKDEI